MIDRCNKLAKMSIKQIYQRDSFQMSLIFLLLVHFRKFMNRFMNKDSSLLFLYSISDLYLPRIKNSNKKTLLQEVRFALFEKKEYYYDLLTLYITLGFSSKFHF